MFSLHVCIFLINFSPSWREVKFSLIYQRLLTFGVQKHQRGANCHHFLCESTTVEGTAFKRLSDLEHPSIPALLIFSTLFSSVDQNPRKRILLISRTVLQKILSVSLVLQ